MLHLAPYIGGMKNEEPLIRIGPHRNPWLDPVGEEILVLIATGPLAVALVILSIVSLC